ncbi:MAG: hypothetical protein QM667_01285 [Asticcacaulis sp.]
MDMRRLMLTIGLGIVICGGAAAAPKGEQPQGPQKVEVINTVQTSEVAKPEKPDPTAVPCDPPADVRTSELCAQWRGVDTAREGVFWAKAAFFLTLFSVVIGTAVSAVTLYYLVKAFRDTQENLKIARLAADESRRAADAADEATDIARRQLKVQSRPWLSFKLSAPKKFVQDYDYLTKSGLVQANVVRGTVHCELFNSGTVPALDVRLYAELSASFLLDNKAEIIGAFTRKAKISYVENGRKIDRQTRNLGQAVFPGQSTNVGAYMAIEIAELSKETENEIFRRGFYIVGCILYRMHGDAEIKHTSFLYEAETAPETMEAVKAGKWIDQRLEFGSIGYVDAS